MEDWKVRLVEEYEQLSNRYEKLGAFLEKEGAIEKVGLSQYKLLLFQFTGMGIYFKALEERIEDLNIDVNEDWSLLDDNNDKED